MLYKVYICILFKGEHKGVGVQPPPPSSTPPYLLATDQNKIPYPKPLKYSNKTKLRLMTVILYRYISLSLKFILVC